MKRLLAILILIGGPAFAADEPVTVLRGASAPPPPPTEVAAVPQQQQQVVVYREIVYPAPVYYVVPLLRRHDHRPRR